jgi:hypothetical protein
MATRNQTDLPTPTRRNRCPSAHRPACTFLSASGCAEYARARPASRALSQSLANRSSRAATTSRALPPRPGRAHSRRDDADLDGAAVPHGRRIHRRQSPNPAAFTHRAACPPAAELIDRLVHHATMVTPQRRELPTQGAGHRDRARPGSVAIGRPIQKRPLHKVRCCRVVSGFWMLSLGVVAGSRSAQGSRSCASTARVTDRCRRSAADPGHGNLANSGWSVVVWEMDGASSRGARL